MADFTSKALEEIKGLGVTHIWYTGVIEHATQSDHTQWGIPLDHPSIVKGKAGSPYAIKDYYDIDPDIATKVDDRMKEFTNLVRRTHLSGMKVIIDFVPNHVARMYHSDSCPAGTKDFGEDDDTTKRFSPSNNFYYIEGEDLVTPTHSEYPDDNYKESPAKASGNDCFTAWPGKNDWYETVKLNYGIDYQNYSRNFNPVPDTWNKMRDILLFWTDKGIDGFRCDMAEMVPCEFWEWVIPQVKVRNPEIIFIAEIYNPHEYRNYINYGHFDYLYDKVGLYDTIRNVMAGGSASNITFAWQSVADIQDHMVNFLENHDEQRIASDFFAGNGERGKAGMIVSALMNTNPVMIYFGQELGERGMYSEGFSGQDGRTTIFDYWTIDLIRRWRNNGKYDGSLLYEDEAQLRDFYSRLLNLCVKDPVVSHGQFYDLMHANYDNPLMDTNRVYAFFRKYEKEYLLVVANFSDQPTRTWIKIPSNAYSYFNAPLERAIFRATDVLTGKKEKLLIAPDATTYIEIPANNGKVLKFKVKYLLDEVKDQVNI